jgi:hypothetical protein
VSGLDRRTLIRRAAAAGVVAWVAPVVIESISSPAGALTGPALSGCHIAKFNSSCSGDNSSNRCNEPPDCPENQQVAGCLLITTSTGSTGCGQNSTVTISVDLALCPNCVITFAVARSGDDCVVPVPDPALNPTTSVVFPAQGSPGYSQFLVSVDCS